MTAGGILPGEMTPARRSSRALFVASGAAVLAMAGCSTHSAGSAGLRSCKTYSACSLLTASDVTAATATRIDAGAENDVNATPSTERAEQVMCTYTGRSTAPFVSLQIRCCPCNDNDPAATPQAYADDATTVTAVDGVGDSAFWVETSPDAGEPVVDLLVVYLGADLQVIVSVSLPLGESFSFDPLAAAKKMAAVAVSRL